jgi:CheY-like chemotaxis protein
VKRILFVDDESKILDGIRRMLHGDRQRWDMQFATGGEAALQACEAGSFDVVISDMRMPGMDGATLLSRIRDRFPGTARIILSGYSEVALATRAVPVAHRFLTKPCNAAQLQATIERVCTLQDILCTPEIRRIVGTIGELPSLSTTYAALAQAVRDPDTSVKRVADIIDGTSPWLPKSCNLSTALSSGWRRKLPACKPLSPTWEWKPSRTWLSLPRLSGFLYPTRALRSPSANPCSNMLTAPPPSPARFPATGTLAR